MPASEKSCEVEGCGKRKHAYGMCASHYYRLRRYGDPLKGRTPDGELARFIAEIAIPYDGDDCLLWPYGRDGHGYGVIKNKELGRGSAHRLICEAANGPPPTPRHEATHTCGSGHLGCVARGHLSWKTHAENMADKIIHGTHLQGERVGTSKLTETEVRKIMALKGVRPHREIAAAFGINQSQVSRIMTGQRWGHLIA